MKQHLKWLWTCLAISGGLYGLVMLGFLFLSPFQKVTESLLCGPDEHLVTETQVRTGTDSGTTTQGCCAKKTDTRAFGKCDWSDSLSRDSLTLLVPMAISLVLGLVGGACITLAIRHARGGARAS